MSDIQTEVKTLRIWTFKMSDEAGTVQVVADTRIEAEHKLRLYLRGLYGAEAAIDLRIVKEIYGGEVIL
jgi:hypothetical protein